MRRICLIASASGNGKTTVGRALAERLDVPFYELDALHHGPDWAPATAEELRAKVEPIVASPGWVVDGSYRGKIGDIVPEAAELIVWLDLPVHVWFPRLLKRTARRLVRKRSSGMQPRARRDVLHPTNSAVVYALRNYRTTRRTLGRELARFPVARLRTPGEVERFLNDASARASVARRSMPPP